jgi:type I restriction enzyme M protein
MKDQIASLYRKYVYFYTEESIAKIIVQSLLLRMLLGENEEYVSHYALRDKLRQVAYQQYDYSYLIEPEVFNSEKSLEIYNQVKDFDLMGDVDDLGIVFEGLMSRADAQKLGAFYTPPTLASLIIQISLLDKDKETDLKIYDPAMGTAGLLVIAHKHILRVRQNLDVDYYGQEFNSTSWKIACINALLYQMSFYFGNLPGSTMYDDKHKDLRADIILANPPYNQKAWDIGLDLANDPRFKDFPKPPSSNGNFAWILHCLYHLNHKGIACIVMANGSLTTNQKDELIVRQYLIKHDLIEAIITLPPKLFVSTGIPCCIWVLNKKKIRIGQMLLIDISSQGQPISKKQNELSADTINKVLEDISKWREGHEIQNINNLVSIDYTRVFEKNFNLSPSQYLEVDVERVEITEESFIEKLSKLIYDFERLADEEKKLSIEIISNLKKLKYEQADNDEI